MKTRTLRLTPENIAGAIAAAADLLKAGGLVAFPTETVYGLGANALDELAVRGIFQAKGRPSTNPLIVHVLSSVQARTLVTSWPGTAEVLAEAFWPGPLTLVLPRNDRVPETVTGGGPTVALRAPAHPVAQALLRATGFPLAAPSANLSEGISPTQARHVKRTLDGRIPMILDGGSTRCGLESTVLYLGEEGPRILRPGPVTHDQLAAVLGPMSSGPGRPVPRFLAQLSPGQQTRHYAPTAGLELLPDGTERVLELSSRNLKVGWLRYPASPCGRVRQTSAPPSVIVVFMPEDPDAYGAGLFAALHKLEEASVDFIVADLPPCKIDWIAIHDRLSRASSAGDARCAHSHTLS